MHENYPDLFPENDGDYQVTPGDLQSIERAEERNAVDIAYLRDFLKNYMKHLGFSEVTELRNYLTERANDCAEQYKKTHPSEEEHVIARTMYIVMMSACALTDKLVLQILREEAENKKGS